MSQPMIGPLCSLCRHIRADYTCAAFPVGIPADIVAGLDHTAPFPGDGGLRFEPRAPGEPAPDFQDLMLEEAREERDTEAELDYNEMAAAYQAKFGRCPPLPYGFPSESCAEHWRDCLDANDPDLDPYRHYPPGVTV